MNRSHHRSLSSIRPEVTYGARRSSWACALNPSTAHAQSRIEQLKGKGARAFARTIFHRAKKDGVLLGAGADTDHLTPATYSNKTRIDANFSAGFGYPAEVLIRLITSRP